MITNFELTGLSILPFPLLLWFPWLSLCIYTIMLSLILPLLLLHHLLLLHFSMVHYSEKATLKFFIHVLKWRHVVLQNLSKFLRLASKTVFDSVTLIYPNTSCLPTFCSCQNRALTSLWMYLVHFHVCILVKYIYYWLITLFSLSMTAFPHSLFVSFEHSPIILVCVSSGPGLLTIQKTLFSANYFLAHCEELMYKYKYMVP